MVLVDLSSSLLFSVFFVLLLLFFFRKTGKKKEVKKTDPPAPSMGDIRKYMKEKITPAEKKEEKSSINNVKNEVMNTPSQKEVILPKDNEDNRISLTEDMLSNTT